MKLNSRSIYDYDTLSLIGKISLWLSRINITPRLKKGSWLDILSGYKSLLQVSQRRNSKIGVFFSLDYKLNQNLKKYGFKLIETHVKKHLPLKSRSFENITIVNGLEHLWNPQEILSECYRLLKLNGILQIIVPTWFSKLFLEFIAFRLKNKQAYIEVDDHKTYYDEKKLWPMLIKAGFKPQSITLKRIKFLMSLYAIATKI